jgi:NADH-quinone oxidoreductase subunit J
MVVAALALLFARKAVHAAFAVMVVMVSFAVLYMAQDAAFLGVVQIVVYTGAVMMLFLFVLMLIGVDASDSLVETIRGQRWIAVVLGLGLGVILILPIARMSFAAVGLADANSETNPTGLANLLFAKFAFPMQVIGILLITAALSALVLTHRRRLAPKVTQGELAAAKVAALPRGGRLTPLAAPGVYAQHNAMDTPALDPQGRPIAESVSRILLIRGQGRSAEDQLAAEHGILELSAPERAQRVIAMDEPVPHAEHEAAAEVAVVASSDSKTES